MDFWREIFMALSRNKLRTFLTGFAISWGIFILIVLLAAGNGIMNAIGEEFSDQSRNVYRKRTSRSGCWSSDWRLSASGRP